MARRRGNTMSSRMADSAKQTGGRLLADWAALTWRADSTKLGPVNLSVINWVLFAICLVGLWFLPGMRKIFLIALAVGFIFTLGRSAAIMPKRRKGLSMTKISAPQASREAPRAIQPIQKTASRCAVGVKTPHRKKWCSPSATAQQP